jgi:hypothetical protein
MNILIFIILIIIVIIIIRKQLKKSAFNDFEELYNCINGRDKEKREEFRKVMTEKLSIDGELDEECKRFIKHHAHKIMYELSDGEKNQILSSWNKIYNYKPKDDLEREKMNKYEKRFNSIISKDLSKDLTGVINDVLPGGLLGKLASYALDKLPDSMDDEELNDFSRELAKLQEKVNRKREKSSDVSEEDAIKIKNKLSMIKKKVDNGSKIVHDGDRIRNIDIENMIVIFDDRKRCFTSYLNFVTWRHKVIYEDDDYDLDD